jgi:hypothetical protein
VREHLLSDVPLGVWLSGGIDSSTVLHYAANESSSRLKTFSISFLGRSFDETAYIREVAAKYGADHQEFDLNPEAGLPEAIEEFAYYFDEPNADGGALPVWFLSKLTKRNVTVALSGEGADELFGGYLTYRANRLASRLRRLPAGVLRLALQGLRGWPVSDEKISFEYMLKRFLEGSQMAPSRGHVYWNGTFSDAEKRALLVSPGPGALDGVLDELAMAGDDLPAYLWFDQKYYLPDDILMKVDRMSMAHAVEVRPPFLDHRIVEFAASLPPTAQDPGLASEDYSEGAHARQAAAIHPAAQESRIRFSRPPVAARAAATVADGHPHERRRRALRLVPARRDRGRCPPAPRAARQSRISPVGVAGPVPVDEAMAHSNDAGSGHGPASGKHFYLYLAVLLIAGAVYLGCIVSPPSLMDDVDAVQAQIARNMLISGDWVTARLDGVPYLEKAPLIYWAIAVSYKMLGVHDWVARLPVALSAVALCWLTAAFGVWAFGDGPDSTPAYACLPAWACSSSPGSRFPT